MATIDYAAPALFTDTSAIDDAAFAGLAADPVAMCAVVNRLVIQPSDAPAQGISAARLGERNIRPADRILEVLLSLDPAPIATPRAPDRRVVGTCRHFALLACALLRRHAIEARTRCGFGTYFQSDLALDHWIVEYRLSSDARWIRLDAEVLGLGVVDHPEDLAPGLFLTGGEAWQAYRRGEIDADRYGVVGTENFGPSEIRGNAVRDLAALNLVEMLPWDEWGRMAEAYEHRTGPDYDQLLDELAVTCAEGSPAEVARLYAHPDLHVPAELAR